MESIEDYWKRFLKETNRPQQCPYAGEMEFADNKEDSIYFLSQILSGQKQANFTTLKSFEIDMESLPKKGFYSILVDYLENPVGVIETVDVLIVPFNQITQEMAMWDGSSSSLEEWRAFKKEEFIYDGQVMGYEFDESMPVVIDKFNLVWKN